MHNRIWMKKPAGWAGELWRESLPIGNGLTSALLCGGAGCEHLWVNRYDRWDGGSETELPDVSAMLPRMRALIEAGRFREANGLLSDALRDRGYAVEPATPAAPIEIRLRFESDVPCRHYRRGVDMDMGEAYVRYDRGGAQVEHRAFVSRADDQVVLSVRSTGELQVKVDLPEDSRLRVNVRQNAGTCRQLDGTLAIEGASELLIFARFDGEPVAMDYPALLERHLPLYRAAMGGAALTLSGGDSDTGTLLDEAFENAVPVELCEKLWRFGRYLFISGTAEAGDPFPLYGLWNGLPNLPWAQNVANENVQMIYWHAPVGGYAHLLRPLIHYYYRKMDAFRVAARRLFGCRGIYVSTYTTRKNSLPTPNVPVIVNYIGCAGWLCQHFYNYWRYTVDEALLKAEILPFMLETAAFYEDYVQRDGDGRLCIVPSVSPENTPGNFIPEDFQAHMGHPNPVVRNATMDFAILKELLTHLLTLNEAFPQDGDRVAAWKAMLRDMPEYMVNDDGALREWMDGDLEDFYMHRHLSHLYPLFPGEEIHRGDRLFDACAKAVSLRRLGGLSGWSMAHMAAIHARLGQGDRALDCLDLLARGCLLPNLFTLHNDWRDMGATLRIDMAPVQLDALMGTVNALQEMLLGISEGHLEFLPACPERFERGEVKNWRFPGGKVSFRWDRGRRFFEGTVSTERPLELVISLPEWTGRAERHVRLGDQQKEIAL